MDEPEPRFKRLKSDDPEVRREAREEQTLEHLERIRIYVGLLLGLMVTGIAVGVWVAMVSADSGSGGF